MKTQFKVIDLFSGCGGSALGFQQAGFEIIAAIDKDKMASATFKRNFPETIVINKDIQEISGQELMKACNTVNNDELIILACPPCQGFSNARRNSQRESDIRNYLINEFVRLVGEIKPYFFVMENVPGLASGIGKPLFTQAIEKLRQHGYIQIVHGVVNTSDYGVPQGRKRLIVIGTRDKNLALKFPNPTHRNPTSDKNPDLPYWKTVRDAIVDLPPIKAGERHEKDSMHVAAAVSELNLTRLQKTPHNGGSRTDWPEELVLECHRRNNGHKDVYGRMRWDSPSPTITGGCSMISKGRYGHPEQDRAISLRESARLQTFTDDFSFVGSFQDIARQIGNAVPSRLSYVVGKTILDIVNEKQD